MEINQINGVIKSVVAVSGITEGRMVFMTSHAVSQNFGSLTDLPGVNVPSTADEAKRARFIVTWPVTAQKPPFYVPNPTLTFALREGFDQAANAPFSATVYPTYPGYQNSVVIPAGTPVRAFGAGTYTAPSGTYVDSAPLHSAGCLVSVNYTGANAGKLQAEATYSDAVVGVVEEWDSSTGHLTFTTKEF